MVCFINDTFEADGRLANYQASNGFWPSGKESSGGSRISQTGAPTPEFWVKNLLFDKIFAKNCTKMKGMGSLVPPTPRIRQCRGANFLTYACIRALRRAKVKRIKEI